MEMKAEKPGLSSATKGEKIFKNMAHEERCTETVTIEIKDERYSSKTSSPGHGNPSINKEDEELESAKAEMGEVKEENERLKKMLDKIENDYRSLQMHFFDILQQDPFPKPADTPEIIEFEQPQTSLCLGKSPVESRISNEITNRSAKGSEDPKLKVSDGLTLELDLTRSSETGQSEMETADPSHETQEIKEDELGETWPPSKVLKTSRSESKESSETNVAKRARVSIRSRCETPTMHDGCQWRKYGQKTAKGNPCPRAYYRCTIAPSCPVRKQVQRCSEDMSILITTYEGTHNHPLPVAATAMASTTSAAASILMSRSSTSQGLASFTAPATATTANINGLNFTIFDNSATRPFNFPHASALAPPTITLDLTSNPSTHLINRFSQAPKFSLTSLDFSSSSEPIKSSMPWGGSSHLNYYPSVPYNKTVPIGTLDFAKQQNGSTWLLTNTPSTSSNQQYLTDTIAKVLTSAPSFQHAVAAAISNMVGSGNFTNSWRASTYGESTMDGSMGNGDQSQVSGFASMNTLPQTGKPCFTSYFSNPSQSTSPAMPSTSYSASGGSSALLQSLLPFVPSKGSSSMAPNIEANNNR